MPFSYGVTPKDYLRILQLQRVLWASRTGMNWAQAALDAGYYDQAYMIAEFREFIGLASSTPYFNVRTWTASFRSSLSPVYSNVNCRPIVGRDGAYPVLSQVFPLARLETLRRMKRIPSRSSLFTYQALSLVAIHLAHITMLMSASQLFLFFSGTSAPADAAGTHYSERGASSLARQR